MRATVAGIPIAEQETNSANNLEGKIVEQPTPTSEPEKAKSGSVVKWGDSAQYHQDRDFMRMADKDGPQGVVPVVTLLSMTPQPLAVVAQMAAIYEGRVVRDLADMDADYIRQKWDDVLTTHLDTPLEAVQLHFLLEGVDRAFTHQLVRQRVGAAYAQESLRFAVVDDLKNSTTLPPSLAGTEPLVGAVPKEGFSLHNKQGWRNAWDQAIHVVSETYRALVDSGMPAEEARGLLPHCTATRVVYVTNLRALSQHAGNRLCTQAQFIWRQVFAQMIDAIRKYETYDHETGGWTDHNWQYEAIADSNLFRPVCYQLGRCPFKASFDRACSIRDRVDRFAGLGIPSSQWEDDNYNQHINPAEWLANPGAART